MSMSTRLDAIAEAERRRNLLANRIAAALTRGDAVSPDLLAEWTSATLDLDAALG